MSEYTIRDVAKLVGVSTGTVSRVLNNAGDVAPEIYEKTMKVIRDTNYKRRRKGRTTGAKGKAKPTEVNNTISVIAQGLSDKWRNHEFWSQIMTGVERACTEQGFFTIVKLGFETESEEMYDELASKSSGVLCLLQKEPGKLLEALSSRMPTIAFGAYSADISVPQVSINNLAAGIKATETLLERGHERIAFINHEVRHPAFLHRSFGYMEVMKKRGLYRPEYLLERHDETIKNVKGPELAPPCMEWALEHIETMPEKPTAAIVANDWGAAGFYRACQNHGLSIPDDVSVLGFDNSTVISGMLEPGLSSIDMPFGKLSYLATNCLIAAVRHPENLFGQVGAVHYFNGDVELRGSIKALN